MLEVEVKACVRCRVEKPQTVFRVRKRSDGSTYRAPTCQECHAATQRKWNARNRGKRREYTRRTYVKYGEKIRARARARHYERKFSISTQERDKLLASQGGVCAICGTDTPKGKGWCVDHCHARGGIRGILCAPCNLVIGHAYECVETLTRAAEYIGKWEGHGKAI